MCLAKLKNGKNYLLRVQGLTPPTRACAVCQFELRAGLSLKKGASDKNSRPRLYRQAAVNRIESRRNRVWTGRRETRGKDATQLAVGGQQPADFPLGVRLAWLAHGRFSRPLLGEVLSPPSSDPSSATGALSFLDRIQWNRRWCQGSGCLGSTPDSFCTCFTDTRNYNAPTLSCFNV